MRVPVKSTQSNYNINNTNNNDVVNSIARSISSGFPLPAGSVGSGVGSGGGGGGGGGNGNNISSNTCYEPTSVLDLCRSPSPVREKPASGTDVSSVSDPPTAEVDEHVLRSMDWDSIMRDLGLDDDSAPNFKSNCNPQLSTRSESQIQQQNQLTEFAPGLQQLYSAQFLQSDNSNLSLNFNIPPDIYSTGQNQNSTNSFDFYSNISCGNMMNSGFDFIEELIRAAECFDSNELQLAQVILGRLNQRIKSPVGKPLQRAAFFFKEALNSLLNESTRSTRLSSWSEIVQSLTAYKAFSGISPIPMFTHFTTNQALLESFEGSPPLIHIIDFDIGFGGQYASFMREIAEKGVSHNSLLCPTSIRITAVVPEEFATETRLIKDNLLNFAHEHKIRFQIEFVLFRTFEMLSFKAVKFMEGEKTAVVLSPTIFRRLGSTNNAVGFVADMRRVSPNVVVLVDNEGLTESGGTTASFRRNFVSSLEYYSVVFESLDAAISGAEWARKIEMCLMRPRIVAAVEGAGRRVVSWREVLCGAGMRPVQLSQFADFQAECLLGKVQGGGFHVAKRQTELVLCWHEWPLVATSAWRIN